LESRPDIVRGAASLAAQCPAASDRPLPSGAWPCPTPSSSCPLPARPSAACWVTLPTSPAWELGAVAIRAAVARRRAGRRGGRSAVRQLPDGRPGPGAGAPGHAPAGLPDSTGAVTLTKMCGSGMRAMMFAHDMLAAGSANVMVAGGMESMTNAPHLMFARKGVKYGAAQLFDHMAMDGLEDAYERGKAMGVFAEQCVDKYRSPAKRRTSSPLRPPRVPSRPMKTAASTGRWRRSLPGKAATRWSSGTNSPSRPSSTRSPASSPRSRRTAPSPRPMRPASATAPRHWCWCARARRGRWA
jgi:hypothetical protein